MLRETAGVLGRRRVFLRVPVMPAALTALTARVVSGAPGQMIGAIVESVPEDTVMRDNPLQRRIEPDALGFSTALRACIDPATKRLLPNPRRPVQEQDAHLMREQSLVRSIQRITLPPGQDAAWIAGNYFRWLGQCCWPLVRTRVSDAGEVEVGLRLPPVRLLTLALDPIASTPDRQVYRITGGVLARGTATGLPRFEFHTLLHGRYTMTAIHDYAPALPWWFYSLTQAVGHLLVMRRYQARLAKLAR
jgi:hypothetical protein